MPLMTPIIVHVDPELEALIPRFLANQRKAVVAMRQAWEAHDYPTLRDLGHRMKGAAGGYGFDALTDLGWAIEEAAKANNALDLQQSLEALGAYLNRLEVVYD
jgi:HPt (histidine-containing phosphotransfer) domain-containing protein